MGLLQRLRRFDSCDSPVVEAQRWSPDSSLSWDYECDVAVVGFGGAGASAALEAREQGADVCLLERYTGGGSTAISGGILYAGGGTAVQREAGVDDDPENMLNYLRQEVQGAVSEQTLRRFCNQSVENYEWLEGHGVEFNAARCPFKTSYPPNIYYYYFSGNESYPPYAEAARPAPRGHRAHQKGISGEALFEPLRQACKDAGVDIQTQTRVDGLIEDPQGRVVGLSATTLRGRGPAAWLHRALYRLLIWLHYVTMAVPLLQGLLRRSLNGLENRFGERVNIRVRNGVVLSTGGFYFNRAMVEQHAPAYAAGMPLGTIGDDGSGIDLGRSVGGRTEMMDHVSAWRFMNPPETFVKGVMVSGGGERFTNEMFYGAKIAEQMVREHDGKAWLIIDRNLWRETWKVLGPRRTMWFQAVFAIVYLLLERTRGRTITELARKLAMPEQQLRSTIEEYNRVARSGGEDPMGKPATHLQPLERGPFFALNASYDCAWVRCPSLSMGGLAVDEASGEVLDRQGRPICGLYAAGRTAVGIPSRSYVSGLSIADCVFSGRRAGRHAAVRARTLPAAGTGQPLARGVARDHGPLADIAAVEG